MPLSMCYTCTCASPLGTGEELCHIFTGEAPTAFTANAKKVLFCCARQGGLVRPDQDHAQVHTSQLRHHHAPQSGSLTPCAGCSTSCLGRHGISTASTGSWTTCAHCTQTCCLSPCACLTSLQAPHRPVSPPCAWFQQMLLLYAAEGMRKIATNWEESAQVATQHFKRIPGIYFWFNIEQWLQQVRLRVVKNVGWGEGLYRAVHPDCEREDGCECSCR